MHMCLFWRQSELGDDELLALLTPPTLLALEQRSNDKYLYLQGHAFAMQQCHAITLIQSTRDCIAGMVCAQAAHKKSLYPSLLYYIGKRI